MSAQPHRTLTNPIFLQRIFFFGTSHACSPVVFNSVTTSWSETCLEYRGAELGWQKLLEAATANNNRKKYDSVRAVLIWCLRTCSHDWIFDNLLESGLELDKGYTNFAFRPIDLVLQTAHNKTAGELGVLTSSVTAKSNSNDVDAEATDEEVKIQRELAPFFICARKLIEAQPIRGRNVVKATTLTISLAIKLKQHCPIDFFRLILDQGDAPLERNEGDAPLLQVLNQQQKNPRKDMFALLLQLGANPFRASGMLAQRTPISVVIQRGNLEFLKLIFLNMKKSFWTSAVDSAQGNGMGHLFLGIAHAFAGGNQNVINNINNVNVATTNNSNENDEVERNDDDRNRNAAYSTSPPPAVQVAMKLVNSQLIEPKMNLIKGLMIEFLNEMTVKFHDEAISSS